MKKAAFIGRFQPFHKGHLTVVQNALKEFDKLIIGIGSSEESYTITNPFTAKERIRIIKAALKQAKIPTKKYFIIELKDIIDCDKEWVKYVKNKLPKFHVIYTGNDWMRRCFKNEKDIQVRNVKKIIDICSTKIRKLFRKGKGWEKFLQKSVIKEIRRIKGIERIKEIYKKG